MRRTPNRTRVPAAYQHQARLARIDAELATGARTAEAVFLRLVREGGPCIVRSAAQLEHWKRHSAKYGGIQERLLCGHTV